MSAEKEIENMLLAKIALGLASTVAFAAIYTFREGVIRVDVDEYRSGGSHVHLWVPAAVVPVALRFAPKDHLQDAAENIKPWIPTIRQLAKELEKYPEANLVEVVDGTDHVQIRTHAGKLQIDVREPGETVHVAVPISTLEDISVQLTENIPGA
jgi:hypothetical protein